MKYILTLLFSLIINPVFAQFIEPNSSNGGTFPPSGCVTANAVIFNNVVPCNSNFVYDGTANIVLGSNIALNWNSDVFFTRSAAATIQFGAIDVNGSPVAQTLKFQSALAASATNTASANTTVIGSLGTGTGTNGDIIFQTGVKTTSGTAQATPITALTIKGETSQLQAVNGSATSPSYSFLSDTGTGFYHTATSNTIGVALGTFQYMSFSPTFGLVLGQQVALGFSTGAPTTPDAILARRAAATIFMGASDAASPVAQTFGVQSVVAGTSNTAGANWTFNASKSTGTGVGGKIILQTTVTGTTGTTVNSNFPMLTLNPGSATTSTIQFGDGTNITTYDSCTSLTTGSTGIIACTASAMRFKDVYSSRPLNLAGLDTLRTDFPWKYRNDAGHGLDTTKIHIGLFADDVEKMDSRCVVYRADGLSDYEDRCLIAYLIEARKVDRAEFNEYKRMHP